MAEKITVEIAGGEFSFYPNSHQYKYNGKNVLSVTAVTSLIDKSRQLIKWAVDLTKGFLTEAVEHGLAVTPELITEAGEQHKIKKEEASTIGTAVHDWCEKYIKSRIAGEPKPEMPTDPNIINGITAFLKWVQDNNVVFLQSEVLVYNPTYDYGGRMDAIAIVDGVSTAIDFKTSKGVYPEAYLQVSAYREASLLDIKASLILHLDKETGEFEVHEIDNHSDHFKAFLGLLEAKKILKVLDDISYKQWKDKQDATN